MSMKNKIMFDYDAKRSQELQRGSNNNPKKHAIITQHIPSASHVLEITSGADVSKCLFDYVYHRGRGISILSGNGEVANVTLRQPTGRIETFVGRFNILSISGTIFPPMTPVSARGLEVCLASTTGQMICGNVMPPLVASGLVVLVVVSFANTANEQVEEGDAGLFNAGGSTSGMSNIIKFPSRL
jgi:predicted DNA-binding protein with PD1-like motif